MGLHSHFKIVVIGWPDHVDSVDPFSARRTESGGGLSLGAPRSEVVSGPESLPMAKTTAAAPATKAPAPKAPKAKATKGVDQRFQQARRASIMLKHVSDPTRLQVIMILSEGEQHVGALCAQLSQSQPAVSHHLALLRHGGIIAPRRQGKNNFYSLTDNGEILSKVVKNLMV